MASGRNPCKNSHPAAGSWKFSKHFGNWARPACARSIAACARRLLRLGLHLGARRRRRALRQPAVLHRRPSDDRSRQANASPEALQGSLLSSSRGIKLELSRHFVGEAEVDVHRQTRRRRFGRLRRRRLFRRDGGRRSGDEADDDDALQVHPLDERRRAAPVAPGDGMGRPARTRSSPTRSRAGSPASRSMANSALRPRSSPLRRRRRSPTR